MGLQIGDKVHYCPVRGQKENGIIKGFGESGIAFVVFKCGGEWDKYKNYTGQSTSISDIIYGLVDDKGDLLTEFCDHHYIPTNAKWQSINQMECCLCGNVIN